MSDKFTDYKNELPAFIKTEVDFDKYKMRHSAEHVLHQAVINLYGEKNVIPAMGPATEEGFYFDCELSKDIEIKEEDFEKIELEMKKIIKSNQKFTKSEVTKEEAKKLFKNNPYKLEWIEQYSDKGLTIYKTGEDFVDLCKGPHVDYTSRIGAFKLLKIAGAYWHGDEKNKMLTRIYGTAFKNKTQLDEYLFLQEEAKKRDHRKLGRELDLFTFSELVGSGLPLYTQRGSLIRRLLNNYTEELQTKKGYEQVWTPQIAKADLFKKSGHYDKYKADMFRVVSNYTEEEMFLKPMNCPQHTQIYSSKLRSYKDLPLRMTDFAMLYRDEKPGELLGLARVRAFSQDDCHIFCREDQVDFEIDQALMMTKEIMKTFGFKYKYRLSTRDPKNLDQYLGDPNTWDKVEKWAVDIMKRNNIEYYDGPGEAAFYAPKMDLIATDSLGREWQLSTVQIDYVMPERFDLKYTDKDGTEKRPIMLHRAILGSPERMIMILIEHFGGAFPTWIAPEQVRIIPISDQNHKYANEIKDLLEENNIRVLVDLDNERMQNKIRKAQELKVPYMLILGKNEEEKKTVSLRYRTGEEIKDVNLNVLLTKLVDNIKNRKIDIKLV